MNCSKPIKRIKIILLLWILSENGFVNALKYGSRVDDFIRQFTSLFSRHALSYRGRNLDTEYLNAIQQHFSKIPPENHHGDDRPHYHGYGFPLRPSPPKPPPGDGDPDPPSSEPHQQTSFIAALDLIAKNDDLRCIPRLLCEVTSGSKVTGSSGKGKDDESFIPFLSRDGLIALLTILNFVDDSPLLLFVRAALLGFSSKGDAEVCLNAYPLCPKDADQLVNYLNNHNGGFFRLFNQHEPQHPHNPPYNDPEEIIDSRDFKFSSQRSRYGIAARILNSVAENYDRPSGDYEKLTNSYEPSGNEDYNKHHIFSSGHQPQSEADKIWDSYQIYPSRNGKKFSFPGQVSESMTTNVMIFPDRTGTGNLVLTGVPSGGLRISYAMESSENRRSNSKLKFSNNKKRSARIMQFPIREEYRIRL